MFISMEDCPFMNRKGRGVNGAWGKERYLEEGPEGEEGEKTVVRM